MNIKEKLTLSVGVLVSLIIGLVAFSVISLQILTATEPTSPVADYGLKGIDLVVAVRCVEHHHWLLDAGEIAQFHQSAVPGVDERDQ